MKPLRTLAVALAISLGLLGMQASSVQAAGVTVGSKCTVLNKTTISAGKTYVCLASGKSKVWKLKIVAKPPVVPEQSAAAFASCVLPVADSRGDVAIGLPRIANRGKDTGTVNTTVIFVDFPDARATMTPQQAFAKVSPRSSEIFSEVSYGKLNYKFNPNFKWLTTSKPSTSYSFASFMGQHDYVAEAIALADPITDFSAADSFLVLSNPDQKALLNGPAVSYSPDWGFRVDGNNLYNGATSGADLNYWGAIWLNHEISHSFGLVDDYAADGNTYETQFKYTGEFSYMGLSDERSSAPGLFAWERFVLGWLDQTQLFCAPSASGNFTITPVETAGGLKAIVVPTSRTSVLVVESRRAIGLDSKLAKPGLLVYRVDTSKTSGWGPIQVISNKELMADPRYLSAPLSVGESVTVDGYTFKHTSTAAATDVLTVTH